MASKYKDQEVQGIPLAPATIVPRSDTAAAADYQSYHHQNKRRKTKNCLTAVFIAAAILAAVVLIAALVLLRSTTPKVRLVDVSVTGNATNDSLRLTGRIRIRNRNFGRYKFDDTRVLVTSSANGTTVGEFLIPDSRVRARSTKRISVMVDLSPSPAPVLGTADLRAEGKVRGKVELLKVFKRRKTADLDCSFRINLSTNTVQELGCIH